MSTFGTTESYVAEGPFGGTRKTFVPWLRIGSGLRLNVHQAVPFSPEEFGMQPVRRHHRILAVAGLSVLGVAAMLPAARADVPIADITGFRAQNLSVASIGCQSVPVTMTVSIDPSVWYLDVSTSIYRGTTRIGHQWFQPNAVTNWHWCPKVEGLGVFRVGPSDVLAYTDTDTVNASDATSTTVSIKARTTMTISTARSGKYVTVTARPRYYSVNSGAYTKWTGATVGFQYRLPGTTTWKSAGTATSNSTYGIATKKVYASSSRYWRAVVSQSTTKWSATSAQASR
ncbi:hypothetical protein [Flindersiella endophytica]